MEQLRKESVKVLKHHDNLKLEDYKPFIHEFQRFSGDIFDFDNNIFQMKKSDNEAVSKLKRSTANEYKNQIENLKVKEGETTDVSPDRINRILKKMPPFIADNLSVEQI
jgi:cysteinyl-tRNA synthetase